MNIRALLSDDDAVSAVIGVILMVAVTVILAAVIGTFVLGIGSQVSGETPKVSMGFIYDNGPNDAFGASDGDDTVRITHRGGDDVDRSTVTVDVAGTKVAGACFNPDWPDPITSGDDTTIDESAGSSCTGLLESGDKIRVIWDDPDGKATTILGTERVP